MDMPPWAIVWENFWQQVCSHPMSQDLFVLIDRLVVGGTFSFEVVCAHDKKP